MSTQIPQPSQAAPDTTRIHNIGYRSYDGPRLGRAYARRSLFSQSLRGAYGLGRSAKSKVLPMLLFGVMCVPALIIVAVAVVTKQTKLSIEYTQYAIFLQVVIGIYLASQAPQSVSATSGSGPCRCTSPGRSSARTTCSRSSGRWPRRSSC